MTTVLDNVIDLTAHMSGIDRAKVSASSAVDQDLQMSGDDVTEFVEALATTYGDWVWEWPWQRFAELSEPSILAAPYLLWRLLTWPIRGRLFDPSPFERLELGHIASVLERGEWSEP